MKKLLTLLLLIAPLSAFADNCNKPSNDFDGLYCLNKVYIESDKDLNSAYKALKKRLNRSAKTKLRSGQRAWIRNRNSSCSRRDGAHFFVNLRCATNKTIKRTNFLNDRIRECKATGCQSKKL
ncbi:MAG: DUF1311 domain-containing protein [Thiotrichaceae bacterium]|nr:DUF1311 domain-containing protein [Thiotrichaceae bacterium]